MKAKILMIGGMAIVISLIPPSTLQAAIADLEPNCAASPYGIDGQFSEQDLKDLFYIAFPQTSVDMRGHFGSPGCFDAVADYYRVEGTTHYVAVDYSGSLAVGFRLWEVYQ
jgi:hypothetical protein